LYAACLALRFAHFGRRRYETTRSVENRRRGDVYGWRGARLGRAADRAKKLVFVGVADLGVLDPVMTGFRPTRNAAYLVFDTLYGIDTEWKAQPQMVEGHAVEEN
jgi:hypothetical protein